MTGINRTNRKYEMYCTGSYKEMTEKCNELTNMKYILL